MTDRTADGDSKATVDPDGPDSGRPDPESPDPGDPGDDSNGDPTDGARTARARIRTTHDRPAAVAAALRPDNTAEMDTRLVPAGGRDGESTSEDPESGDDRSATGDGRAVVTVVGRDRAAGLRSTVDDYLVNVDVADRTVRTATTHDTP